MLADQVRREAPQLQVLVHNAAVVPLSHTVGPDGLELQFSVNHLAVVHLTWLLLPLLRDAAPARIVVVSSQVERDGTIAFDDLQGARRYDPYAAYRQSKLANLLFTRALARRLAGTGVTVNALHPGIAGTKVLNALVGRPKWAAAWTRYRQPGAEAATATLLRVVTDPTLATVTGGWFNDEVQSDPSVRGQDDAVGERRWSLSNALIGLPADWP